RSLRFIKSSFLMCAASLVLIGCNSNTIATGTPGGSGNSNSNVAYVYVNSQPVSSGPGQIVAYAVNNNGQLTPVPGSPFNQDVGSMATTSAYLVAATNFNSGQDINTYTIESNGALSPGPQFDYSQVAAQISAQTGAKIVGPCGARVDSFD